MRDSSTKLTHGGERSRKMTYESCKFTATSCEWQQKRILGPKIILNVIVEIAALEF